METRSENEIIAQFEAGRVACDAFHHADHVQLAFAYLREYPLLIALDRFAKALKQFATACGKSQLYHETITFVYIFLIHERMAINPDLSWKDFCTLNADLLVWKPSVLARYYREETLKSDLARRVFVLPDLNAHSGML